MGDVRDLGRVPLSNVPMWLRALADQVERRQDVTLVAVAIETRGDDVETYGAGEQPTRSRLVGLLTRAAARQA